LQGKFYFKELVIVLNRPYIALISAQIIDELNLKYDFGIIGNQLVINAILRC